MIKAKVLDFSPNKVKLSILEGCITIEGPVTDLIRKDFKRDEVLFVILGRRPEVLPSDTAN